MWKNIEWTNKTPSANKCKFLYHFQAVRFHVSHTLCVVASMSVGKWYSFYNTFINQVRELVNISTKKFFFANVRKSFSFDKFIELKVWNTCTHSCWCSSVLLLHAAIFWIKNRMKRLRIIFNPIELVDFLKFFFFIFHLKVALFFPSTFEFLARLANLRKHSNLMRTSRTNQNCYNLKTRFDSHIHPFKIHGGFRV